MQRFISAKYVVACTLLEMYKKGRKYARLAEFKEIGDNLQDLFNKNNKDVIVLTSLDDILDVIFGYDKIYKRVTIPNEGLRIYLNTWYDLKKLEKETYIYGHEIDDLVLENIGKFVDDVLKET